MAYMNGSKVVNVDFYGSDTVSMNKFLSYEKMSYKTFVDLFNLKGTDYVDLSFVGGEYYYPSFSDALIDINAGNLNKAKTSSEGASVQVFKNGNITVIRLLENAEIGTQVEFEESVIIDLNGKTINTNYGRLGVATNRRDISVIFYGMKDGSGVYKDSLINTLYSQVIEANYKYFAILGGNYSVNCSCQPKRDDLDDDTKNITGTNQPYVSSCTVDVLGETVSEIYNANIEWISTFDGVIDEPKYLPRALSIGRDQYDFTDEQKVSTNVTISNCNITAESTNNTMMVSAVVMTDSTVKIIGGEYIARGRVESIGIIDYYSKKLDVINAYAYGIHAGIQVQGKLYAENSTFESCTHGGIYGNASGISCITNCESIRCAMPKDDNGNEIIYETVAYGSAYFGDGHIAYIDNSIFSADNGIPPLVVKSNEKLTKHSTVFISNSTIPAIRCDVNNKIYSGYGNKIEHPENNIINENKYDTNYAYVTLPIGNGDTKKAFALLEPLGVN